MYNSRQIFILHLAYNSQTYWIIILLYSYSTIWDKIRQCKPSHPTEEVRQNSWPCLVLLTHIPHSLLNHTHSSFLNHSHSVVCEINISVCRCKVRLEKNTKIIIFSLDYIKAIRSSGSFKLHHVWFGYNLSWVFLEVLEPGSLILVVSAQCHVSMNQLFFLLLLSISRDV